MYVLLTAFLLISGIEGWSTIRLPSVVSSNMVLQQQSKASLWGWGDPGEKVTITTSWNATDSLIVNSDGSWIINIPTPTAGGPYTITFKGWNTIILNNVMIGEVWFCSGQSNMEWSGYNNNKQILDELPNSKNEKIRFFHIPRTTSDYPQDDCKAQWEICGPETLRGFSAIGYFFGKKLNSELNIPIGLIEAAWGGTPIETFTPAPVIAGDPVMQGAAAKLQANIWGPHKAGKIYNGMIAPVINFDIAGALWYQGEANVSIGSTYQKSLTSMIAAWRKAWQKDFPFYYVQIAPYAYGTKNEGAILMEQQAKAVSNPHVGMVVITDLVDNVNDIHPQNKYDVAMRLAKMALAEVYRQIAGGYKSPSFRSMTINKNEVTLLFDNAPNGFLVKGASPTEFYIAGADKNFLPADVKIEKDRIIVSNKQIAKPVAVRFGFSNTAMPNLFNKEGLPVTPFRTDNWEE